MMDDDQWNDIEKRLATGRYPIDAEADIKNLMADIRELKGIVEALRVEHRTKLDEIWSMVRQIRFRLENYLYGGRGIQH